MPIREKGILQARVWWGQRGTSLEDLPEYVPGCVFIVEQHWGCRRVALSQCKWRGSSRDGQGLSGYALQWRSLIWISFSLNLECLFQWSFLCCISRHLTQFVLHAAPQESLWGLSFCIFPNQSTTAPGQLLCPEDGTGDNKVQHQLQPNAIR